MNTVKEAFFQKMKESKMDASKVNLEWKDDILILSGEMEKWQQVVDVGHLAAKISGVTKLVNHLTSKDMPQKEKKNISSFWEMKENDKADVVIIGAGITGCAIARQLSKYKLNVLVLEKEDDISCGTTKSNNGMIHSGYDSKHGSLKAEMNVKGNAMYTQWAQDLHFAFKRTGSFVLEFNEKEHEVL